MIITRTPFRVSFFGGGTDYPKWYREHRGSVLATSIDKYCYLSCRYLPPFFEARYRTVYNKIEVTKTVAEIQHPSVRACLGYLGFDTDGTEIVHYSDLPSRTGIGSSSSFTVGLLHALSGLKGKMPSKRELAAMAIHVEQTVLAENVGSQDQVLAAFGGFNVVDFDDSGFSVRPVTISAEREDQLRDSLMLLYTGITRFASEIAGHQIENIGNRKSELRAMHEMVDGAIDILVSGDITDFGRLLHESWMLKSRLSDHVSTAAIDDIYATARAAGAIGGKLLGAGGGGFVLLFVEPEKRPAVKRALAHLLEVPFRFERLGTQVVYYHAQPSEIGA